MGVLDDDNDSQRGSVVALEVPPDGFNAGGNKMEHLDDDGHAVHPMELETKERRKKRYVSIYIVHAGMAIFSLGFSIVITGVLPYMKRLLPSTDAEQITFLYGIVVSMNPLGQMICSPLSGIISNKLGSIRLVCLITSGMYIAGNLLYAILTVFPESARLAMLIVARVLTGVASANNANMRSYVASSTYQAERTTQMSISSSMQSLGFIVGPAIQAAITPLKCEKIDDLSEPYFSVDMFSLAGWISVFFGIISFVMFMPGIFVEYGVMAEERDYNAAQKARENATNNAEPEELPKPNYLVASVCIIAFFFYLFNFIIVETLGTPLCMDEFGWTEEKTILLLGAAMSIGGIISMGGFLSVGYLAKKYDERLMMIFLGIIPMFLSRVLMLPFPGQDPPITHDEIYPNGTDKAYGYPDKSDAGFMRSLFMLHPNTYGYRGADVFYTEEDLAAAGEYAREREECQEGGADYCVPDWCEDFPGIMEWQFFLGVILTFVCYPYCLAIVQALFSKVLGPRPQGFWMGLLTSAGSLARFLGPIFVTTVYTNSGPYLSIGLVAATMIITILLVLAVYPKLVPLGAETARPTGGTGDEVIGEVSVHHLDSDSD